MSEAVELLQEIKALFINFIDFHVQEIGYSYSLLTEQNKEDLSLLVFMFEYDFEENLTRGYANVINNFRDLEFVDSNNNINANNVNKIYNFLFVEEISNQFKDLPKTYLNHFILALSIAKNNSVDSSYILVIENAVTALKQLKNKFQDFFNLTNQEFSSVSSISDFPDIERFLDTAINPKNEIEVVEITPLENPDSNIIEVLPEKSWGIKLSFSDRNFYLKLPPAVASSSGKNIPNALPGLAIKVKPNIRKFKVPGQNPVYQHLGTDSIMATVVGMFTDADGEDITQGNSEARFALTNSANTYDSFLRAYNFLSSKEPLTMTINANRCSNSDSSVGTLTKNPTMSGYLKGLETYYARANRTYYAFQIEVIDLENAVDSSIDCLQELVEYVPDTSSIDILKDSSDISTSNKTSNIADEDLLAFNSELNEEFKQLSLDLENSKVWQLENEDGSNAGILFRTDELKGLIGYRAKVSTYYHSSVPINQIQTIEQFNEVKLPLSKSKADKYLDLIKFEFNNSDLIILGYQLGGCVLGIITTVTAAISTAGTASFLVAAISLVPCIQLASEIVNILEKTYVNKAKEDVVIEFIVFTLTTFVPLIANNLVKKSVAKVSRKAGSQIDDILNSQFVKTKITVNKNPYKKIPKTNIVTNSNVSTTAAQTISTLSKRIKTSLSPFVGKKPPDSKKYLGSINFKDLDSDATGFTSFYRITKIGEDTITVKSNGISETFKHEEILDIFIFDEVGNARLVYQADNIID